MVLQVKSDLETYLSQALLTGAEVVAVDIMWWENNDSREASPS